MHQGIGNRTKVKVAKNKLAAPFREVEFDLMYGEGISKEGSLLDLAAEQGIIEKGGAWFTYNKEKIGQGRENAKSYLKSHPEVMEEITRKVKEAAGLLKKKESEDLKVKNVQP